MKSYKERKDALREQAKSAEDRLRHLEDKRALEIGRIALKFGLDSLPDKELSSEMKAVAEKYDM